MTNPNIKIGALVQIIAPAHTRWEGRRGVIIETRNSADLYEIRTIDGNYAGEEGSFFASEFRIIRSARIILVRDVPGEDSFIWKIGTIFDCEIPVGPGIDSDGAFINVRVESPRESGRVMNLFLFPEEFRGAFAPGAIGGRSRMIHPIGSYVRLSERSDPDIDYWNWMRVSHASIGQVVQVHNILGCHVKFDLFPAPVWLMHKHLVSVSPLEVLAAQADISSPITESPSLHKLRRNPFGVWKLG